MSKLESKIGYRNGAIVITDLVKSVHNNKGITKLKIKCDCGNENIIWANNFSRTLTCGKCDSYCGNKHKSFKGYQEIHKKVWYNIQRRAASRGIEFKLTIEDAWNLFIKQNRKCAISGQPIQFGKKIEDGTATASLDRIYSNKPYILSNVQWVHKDMNEFKWDKTPEELIKACEIVLNYEAKKKITSIPIEDIKDIVDKLGNDNLWFTNQTVLLTGSSGFLGTLFQAYFLYINEHVLKTPCKVICMDNKSNWIGATSAGFPNFKYVTHNIVSPITPEIQNDKINYIINAAGLASPRSYEKYPKETVDVSFQGTQNVLSFASWNGVKSVLNFSSSEVYGTPPDSEVPTKESYVGHVDTMNLRSCYDVGKMAIETLSYIYNKEYGVNVKVVRPFNVIGYIQQSDGRVLPNFISNILQNKTIKIYGNGKQTRTFCWFSDFLVGAIKILLHGGNSPYNIGNQNNEISMYDLGKLLEKISGKENLIELIPTPDVYLKEPLRRCPDITKAKNELNYNPSIDLETGIRKFFEWAKVNYKY